MLCPCCHTRLKEESNAGVLLAGCSTCQGLWLRREEMEKLIRLIQEVERSWSEERRLYERRPHYYEDDDHYYLQYVQVPQHNRPRVLADICDIFLGLHSQQGARPNIR